MKTYYFPDTEHYDAFARDLEIDGYTETKWGVIVNN